MSSPNCCNFSTSIYGIEHANLSCEDLFDDIQLEDDIERPRPLGGYIINPRKRVSGMDVDGPAFHTFEVGFRLFQDQLPFLTSISRVSLASNARTVPAKGKPCGSSAGVLVKSARPRFLDERSICNRNRRTGHADIDIMTSGVSF